MYFCRLPSLCCVRKRSHFYFVVAGSTRKDVYLGSVGRRRRYRASPKEGVVEFGSSWGFWRLHFEFWEFFGVGRLEKNGGFCWGEKGSEGGDSRCLSSIRRWMSLRRLWSHGLRFPCTSSFQDHDWRGLSHYFVYETHSRYEYGNLNEITTAGCGSLLLESI